MTIIVEPGTPVPVAARRVTLGPLALPTLIGELKETVGEQLETVGAGVVAGERRPRPFPLTIPVHGAAQDLANRFIIGNRLRRQVRALMENSRARMEGLYLAFSADPEQNGWLLVGGGDLSYGQGGISLAEYRLELTDCYRVANLRTHRPARRIVRLDRRLATTARDTLGAVFSTDFAASTATARHHLPVGVSDAVIGSTRRPVALSTVSTVDGTLAYADGLVDGDIIDFEQGEADMNRAIVRILDRQGSGTESAWEQVYGPDQPLTPADIPIIDNALCRIVFDATTGRMDVQAWSGSAWVTDATVAPPAGMAGIRASVVQWTPERGVLAVTGTIGSPVTSRVRMLITLQRGWTGPRVELYHDIVTGTTGTANATISVYTKTVGDATLQRSSGTVAITSGGAIGAFTGLAPWALLLGPGTDRAIHLSVLQAALTLTGAVLSGREGVTATAAGYVSIWLGLAARATGVTDATAHGQRGLTDAQVVSELISR